MASLVERGYELGLLDELFSDTSAGHGHIVLMDGVAASGKTELLRTFADRRAGDGVVVLGVTGRAGQQHLPHGCARQLLAAMRLPADRTGPLAGVIAAPPGPGHAEGTSPHAVDVVQWMSQLVLELSEQATVLITVDDAQHVDAPSMECFLHVAQQTRSARVMLVMAESVYDGSMQPAYRIELIRQTNFRRLRLAPLSADGVAQMLAQHVDRDTAHRLGPSCHAITAGNPLLVRALIMDQFDSPRPAHSVGPDARPVAGEAFHQAVLTCLRRSGPDVLDVARAVAVLDRDCTAGRVGAMLHLKTTDVERILHVLRLLGCVEDQRFRDPLFRQAVLDCVEPGELTRLHTAAAHVLHDDEAGAEKVARYLVAAGGEPDDWAVTQLWRAAEELLRSDDTRAAIRCLEYALTGTTGGRRSAALRILLLRAEWRANPGVAARHLSRLSDHAGAGELDLDQTIALLHCMLWSGRARDAEDLLDHVGRDYATPVGQAASSLKYIGMWLRHSHPELADRWAAKMDAVRADRMVVSWSAKASGALGAVLAGGRVGAPAAAAESVLQATALGDQTVEAVWPALRTLIYADRLDTAVRWCDSLLAEAKIRGVAWWEAVFSACRADIALRHGELPKASGYATRAIAAVGVEGWGVGVGLPLGVQVSASTVMGDHKAVQAHLRQPVPEAMFDTGFGLPYLRARGRYYLANGWFDSALADFYRCGELMTAWGFEAPTLAPWRTDAAEAHLRLGEADKAARLAKEQLDLADTDSPRVYGTSLRILAATVDVTARLRLLKETVELLQASGDRLGLAHALFELSRTHQALGHYAKARMVSHRAGRLVQACRLAAPAPDVARNGEETHRRPDDESVVAVPAQDTPRPTRRAVVGSLTLSEQRVAALASLGYTNREISAKLHITVSTVEQHLTKIFRKLNVSSRTDLPADLELDVERAANTGNGLRPGRNKVHIGTPRTLRADPA